MNAPLHDHAAWSRPALQARVVATRHDGRHEALLSLGSGASPQQILRMQAMLHTLPGMHRQRMDVAAGRLRLSWDPLHLSLPSLLAAIESCGLSARPLARSLLDDPRRGESHQALKQLIVAGLFAMQAMMFASVLYIGHFEAVDDLTRQLFRWLTLLAATPVVTWAAWPIYREALTGLRRGRPGLMLPAAMAALLIYLGSAAATLRGHGAIYFDSVSMFVFVLLVGRYLEMRARHRNGAQRDALADAEPVAAERRRADGQLEWVALDELQPGDHVHVADGDRVPADGVLENDSAWVDAAVLSGESRAQRCRRGSRMAAGSVVVEGPVELCLTHAVADSTLARLDALARRQDALGRDPGVTDRLALAFALGVLALAVLTSLAWLRIDPARAFDAAVAVLVVACPCAFALATPATHQRLLAMLGRIGVLVTRPAALLTLPQCTRALFDKTGTLTAPRLDVAGVEPLREGYTPSQLLHLAAALARESRHPVAAVVADAASGHTLPRARHVHVRAGGGIEGTVLGHTLRLGRAGFVDASGLDPRYENVLLLADYFGPLAALDLQERLQPGALGALDDLRSEGLQTDILSGDAEARVARIAQQLGVTRWHARQMPQHKLERLQAHHAAGEVILAVGDGINDAPLLAAADVSAAVEDSTALARAHADLLLTGGLESLPRSLRLARRAGRLLRRQRHWALAYNVAALPFAALGLVPPWLAALGMSASSLLVVLSTLSLREDRRVDSTPLPGPVPTLRERST